MEPMTRRFVKGLERFARQHEIDIVKFERKERKDDRTKEYLSRWQGGEGILYIGKAQERARVLRTERRYDPVTGTTYPWLTNSTAMVNHYYIYIFDEDFGPLFLKFCSYFPYNAKLCRARISQDAIDKARHCLRGTTAFCVATTMRS